MFLIDTNVLSELRKAGSPKANQQVINWAALVPVNSLYLSAITVLEVETGILQIERRDSAQGKLLRTWFDKKVLPAFEKRILPVDTNVAIRCAQLHVPNPRSERDALIAATALVHDLPVATRNTSDFEATGVSLINPWLET